MILKLNCFIVRTEFQYANELAEKLEGLMLFKCLKEGIYLFGVTTDGLRPTASFNGMGITVILPLSGANDEEMKLAKELIDVYSWHKENVK